MIFVKPKVPGQNGGRHIFLLLLIAAGVLTVLLGRNGLLGVEGDFASGVRLLMSGEELFLRSGLWKPDNLYNGCFCYLLERLSPFTGMSEWVLRLPAVTGGLLLLAGCAVLAEKLLDKRGMWLSGLMLLGSYGFLHWSRCAAMAVFAAAVVMWVAVFAYGNEKEQFSFREVFSISLLSVIALIFTGVTAWMTIILLLLPRICSKRFFKSNKAGRILLPLLCGAVAAVVVALLLQLFMIRDFSVEAIGVLWDFQKAAFERSLSEFIIAKSGDEWYRELINVPRLLLPWPLFTFVALCSLCIRSYRMPLRLRQILSAAAVIFVALGIFPGRSWEELLPLLPLLIILTAAGMLKEYGVHLWMMRAETVMRYIFIVVSSLALALPATWPLWYFLLGASAPLVITVALPLAGAAALAAILLGLRKNLSRGRLSGLHYALTGTVVSGVCLMAGIFCVLQPALTKFRTGRPFWKKTGELYRNGSAGKIIFYGTSPKLSGIYYMNIKPEQIICVQDKDGLLSELKKFSSQDIAVVTFKDPVILNDISDVCRETGREKFSSVPLLSEGFSLKMAWNSTGNAKKELGVWVIKP